MAAASDGAEGGVDAYVEASVLVAKTVIEDVHHADAARVLDEAARGGWRLITTYAVILEVIDAVRRKVIASHRRQSGGEEERAGVEASAEDAVARTIRITKDMVNQGILEIVSTESKPLDYSSLCDKALAHRGRAVYAVSSKSYRHRGIGAFDLMHYAFARDAGASVIITSDAAFADIEGSDDEFGHIRVQLTGEPLIGPLGGGQYE